MKNQVKTPVQILLEILIIIFINSVKFLISMGQLLLELYLSLKVMSYSNPIGFIFAVAIGGIIIIFTIKYMFGSTIDAMKVVVIYIVILVILMTVLGENIDMSQIDLNSTP
jgi:hypothetical protein